MPYNPGVQDMSGQLRAQGKLAQVQGVASGFSSGFESYQQNKMRNQVLQGENEGLLKVFMQDEETKKYAPTGIEKYLKKAESGGGMTLDDNIRLNGMLNSAIKTRGVIDQQNQAAAEAGFRKAAATRLSDEDARLQEFRKSLATDYNAGVRNLNDYNTYAGIQESLRNIDAPSTIGAGAIPQTPGPALGMNRPQPVFGSQLPQALPQFDSQMSPSASGVPPSLSRFEPAPMQINAPQSVFGLDQSMVRQAPPPAAFDTPEKINDLIYDYTPGSDSLKQQMRGYGGMATPEIMFRENQIRAGRDKAELMDKRSQVIAANTEMRRREAAIQQARDEARAAATFEMAQRNEKRLIEEDKKRDAQTGITNTRAASADRRAEETANEPPAIGTVVAGDLGAAEQRRLESINKEIDNNPEAKEALRRIRKKFGVVPKERAQGMKEYINSLPISTGAKNLILGETRE